MEDAADGLPGIWTAAGKVCLEFYGDLSPDGRATGTGVAGPEGDGRTLCCREGEEGYWCETHVGEVEVDPTWVYIEVVAIGEYDV